MLTTTELGPRKTVSVISFRIALKLDVRIVWFGCQMAICVKKLQTSALFGFSRIQKLNFDCFVHRLLNCSKKIGNIFHFACPLWSKSSFRISGIQIYSTFFGLKSKIRMLSQQLGKSDNKH